MKAKKPDIIECLACSGTEIDGCIRCGGFGVILITHECAICQQRCWVKPGVTTMYEGKVMKSFDGLDMIYSLNHGAVCETCYKVDL